MNIPDPKVKYGDRVLVQNYRCSPPRWEEGEARSIQYKCGFGGDFSWQYDVFIDRGKKFFLYVNDDGIEKLD